MGHPDGLLGLGELLGTRKRLRRRLRVGWLRMRRRLCGSPKPVQLAFPFPGPLRESRGKWWLRACSVAIAAWISIFVIDAAWRKLDPFGLNYAAGQHSGELGARTLAPFYASDAQSRVVVVLVDEGTLRARGMSWPPPYAYHEEMLRRILRGQPRAVYVDLLLTDRRGDPSDLAATRAALADDVAAAGVPVFYARAAPDADYLFAGIPGIALPYAGWQKSDGAYPLSLAPHQAVDAGPASGECTGVPGEASVALALYDASCRIGPGGLGAGCREPASGLQDRCAPMWVQWGMRAPPVLPGVSRVEECDALASTGTGAALKRMLLRDFWSGLDPAGFLESRVRCPYTVTLFEQELGRDTVGLLRDKVVLVGASLVGLDDSVDSPVHGRLPGVYLHAMATDNLMTYGNAHPRPPFSEFTTTLVVGLFAAFGLALVLKWRLPGPLRVLLLCLLGVLVALVPAWLSWTLWHRAPPNWIAVVAVFMLIAFKARKRLAGQERQKR
jgi:hypothetical protein